ncbi:MAG: hypothetical protein GWM90_05050, partial [Gemmatimonadetes bacterium]|nr:hypothetical protein [Gemmatimonadota bacterium]NIQ53099.1 hypothetical protein [Gemmatimonadota bacterium]NIU73247.1 hypothetical protein [Gammaproteobacteria bacterium]NIX43508.1 hypothetical protein [Gemmatimonadota bacterium]NIY07687.1 hypothetical protein [Gemmatimonadota bacterium]
MTGIADRAETLLRTARRMAVPLPRLARELGAEPQALSHHLIGDDRFVLLEPAAYP